jgi:hypothetical protein
VPRFLYVLPLLAFAACKQPTGLLKTDTPYTLRTINGQLLPYAVNGTANGPMVTDGSITFFQDHSATRHERRRRQTTATDSAVTVWTQPGTFYTQLGRVVLKYQGWPTPQGGPPFAADTLFATKTGGYVLNQGGLKLLYCPGTTQC